jgi:hypothetical protein
MCMCKVISPCIFVGDADQNMRVDMLKRASRTTLDSWVLMRRLLLRFRMVDLKGNSDIGHQRRAPQNLVALILC